MADPAVRCSRRNAVKRSRVFRRGRNLNGWAIVPSYPSECKLLTSRQTHITGTHGATMVMQLGMSRKWDKIGRS